MDASLETENISLSGSTTTANNMYSISSLELSGSITTTNNIYSISNLELSGCETPNALDFSLTTGGITWTYYEKYDKVFSEYNNDTFYIDNINPPNLSLEATHVIENGKSYKLLKITFTVPTITQAAVDDTSLDPSSPYQQEMYDNISTIDLVVNSGLYTENIWNNESGVDITHILGQEQIMYYIIRNDEIGGSISIGVSVTDVAGHSITETKYISPVDNSDIFAPSAPNIQLLDKHDGVNFELIFTPPETDSGEFLPNNYTYTIAFTNGEITSGSINGYKVINYFMNESDFDVIDYNTGVATPKNPLSGDIVSYSVAVATTFDEQVNALDEFLNASTIDDIRVLRHRQVNKDGVPILGKYNTITVKDIKVKEGVISLSKFNLRDSIKIVDDKNYNNFEYAVYVRAICTDTAGNKSLIKTYTDGSNQYMGKLKYLPTVNKIGMTTLKKV